MKNFITAVFVITATFAQAAFALTAQETALIQGFSGTGVVVSNENCPAAEPDCFTIEVPLAIQKMDIPVPLSALDDGLLTYAQAMDVAGFLKDQNVAWKQMPGTKSSGWVVYKVAVDKPKKGI